MSNNYEFAEESWNDYEFPLLGILYSIKKEKVYILYEINVYSMTGEAKQFPILVSSDTEEHADAYAASQGDIIYKAHLHSILTYAENEYMQKLAKQAEERIAENGQIE
jgi:hypothetical protein